MKKIRKIGGRFLPLVPGFALCRVAPAFGQSGGTFEITQSITCGRRVTQTSQSEPTNRLESRLEAELAG